MVIIAIVVFCYVLVGMCGGSSGIKLGQKGKQQKEFSAFDSLVNSSGLDIYQNTLVKQVIDVLLRIFAIRVGMFNGDGFHFINGSEEEIR